MRRRHRRKLFNVFAFLLLAIAVYLNIFRMNDKAEFMYAKQSKVITKEITKPNTVSKNFPKEN